LDLPAGLTSKAARARIALGLRESPMHLGGAHVCSDWLPLKERALPISIFNASSALTPALAPPLMTWVMVVYGRRVMFIWGGRRGGLQVAHHLGACCCRREHDWSCLRR
jgi:hypothetical protein